MTKPDSTDAGGVTCGHVFIGQLPREQWHERCARCGCGWGERNLTHCLHIERGAASAVETDAGGVTHEKARVCVQQFRGLGLDYQRDELNRYIDQQEAALATLTRERDSLKSRLEQADVTVSEVFGALHNPFIGDDARMEKLAELLPITLSQYERKAPSKPATTPAPLPGGQGPVEALRREIVEALRYTVDNETTTYGFLTLADRLEQGGEGRGG